MMRKAMYIRIFVVAALAFSVSAVAFAGTCSCANEISNASAKIYGSCSKIWSNNHCTLTESSFSSFQLNQRFRNDLSLGILRLTDALEQIDILSDDAYDDLAPHHLAERFRSYDYITSAENQCRERSPVNRSDLVMLLIDPLLTFGDDNFIYLMLKPEVISSLVDAVIQSEVARLMCTTGEINTVSYSSGTLNFGGGCIGYGNSETNVATDLGNFSDCVQMLYF